MLPWTEEDIQCNAIAIECMQRYCFGFVAGGGGGSLYLSFEESSGEFVDGQTIGQLTGEFVDGQTIELSVRPLRTHIIHLIHIGYDTHLTNLTMTMMVRR
jgi:hypothetical protein